MTRYRKVAVFGATGRVGREVTRALAEEGFDVVPISRQVTVVAGIKTQKLASLETFDVVVSTVGLHGKAAQLDLIQQAKDQGVKQFIASEYGVHPDTDAGKSDFFTATRELRQILHDAGFPDGWTAIASGFFDNILPLLVGADVNALSITVRGSGQVRHSFTLRYDIGRVLAATFDRPLEYKDTWITVANAWYTLEDVAHKVEQFTGRDWQVRKTPTDMKMPILHLTEENG
ncbi:Pinoresinol reductase 1-like protein 3 [Colletotrichum chrysophilum]|uniref:Pinoresinol reductase 1-like protein 3 n=1 Tax=Colletotrichum chrysophilum TaxID=1836956 RepID=A0AAD9EDC5_9PEZI|nr:Pinoresinol reductase 1-like protein 3 [Colletotrichum chrysophilum]